MKFLKKLFFGLLILVLITTITLWIVAKSLKPETIKNYVSTQLSSLTAQKSSINGDISWQFFPHPGIKITQLIIGDEKQPMNYSVNMENLFFNLKITPLLRGKLVFSELNLDGFKIIINPDTPIPATLPKIQKAPTESDRVSEQFAIERILLSRGQIIVNQNQQKIVLNNLQIGAEQFNLQAQLFPLQFKTQLSTTSENNQRLKAHINFKGSTSLSASLFKNPLLALQNTPLEGQLSIQDLKLNQLKINKINATVKTKPGIFLLNPLTLNFYNGESVGDLAYEFASKKLIVNQTATNFDGAKLIYDLTNQNLFKGTVDFSIHLQANLQDSNWQDNTSGNGSLTIKDGSVESVNLEKVIQITSDKISNLISGKNRDLKQLLELAQFDNPEFFKGSTAFKLLTFQYRLQNANLITDSLVLQTDKLQLKGESSLNLKDYALSSHLLAKFTLSDEKVEKIQQFLGGSFPILIQGSLTTPIVLPDLQKINPLLSKAWLQDTVIKPVKKKIEQELKTLFKQI